MDPMDALSRPRGFEVELGFVASRGPVSRGTFEGKPSMKKTIFFVDCVTYILYSHIFFLYLNRRRVGVLSAFLLSLSHIIGFITS
jgi:hypothetical protein